MKDFFPESLGQKHGCALYVRVHYTWKNMAYSYDNQDWCLGREPHTDECNETDNPEIEPHK